MTPEEKHLAKCWLDTYFPDIEFSEMEIARTAKMMRGEWPKVGPDGKFVT